MHPFSHFYKSLLCAHLRDKGKVWPRCNRVKVIYMCHRTVTSRIHSTATTKETENSIKTQDVCLLGVSASCAMSPAHLGHWVSVSCQCQVESRNANGPLPHCVSTPSPFFSLCCTCEGGKAINFPLVVGALHLTTVACSLCLYKRQAASL